MQMCLTTQVASCSFPNFGRMNGLQMEIELTFDLVKSLFQIVSPCAIGNERKSMHAELYLVCRQRKIWMASGTWNIFFYLLLAILLCSERNVDGICSLNHIQCSFVHDEELVRIGRNWTYHNGDADHLDDYYGEDDNLDDYYGEDDNMMMKRGVDCNGEDWVITINQFDFDATGT